MITECIAGYKKDQDIIQVVALLQDEQDAALYQKLKTATVKLLHNDVPILTKSLERRDYIEERKSFYVFFINPPIQRYTNVEFAVELTTGETSRVRSAVRHDVDWQYEENYQNPIKPGKTPFDYTDDQKNPI